MKKTEPSGFIFAACEAPTVPPAPPRLSIRIWQPSWSATCAASGRAKTSVPPPAGIGLIQVMVPGGHFSGAWAVPTVEAATASLMALRREIDGTLMSHSLYRLLPPARVS